METGRWTPALLLSLTFLLGLSLGYIIRDTVRYDDPRLGPRPEFGPGMGGEPGAGGPIPLQLIERMASSLELTDDQRTELDRILEDNRQKMISLRQDVQPRQRAIADSTRMAIEALFTPEQMRRYREFRRNLRLRRPGQGQRGGPRRPPF